MNLTELGAILNSATDILRVETHDQYRSDSDADMPAAYLRGEPKPSLDGKRPWLDMLAQRADAGHPVRWLRVVRRPVSDYVRYSCEWGYADGVAHGQDVRVLDENDYALAVDHPGLATDLYIADGRVLVVDYDAGGRFGEAYEPGGDLARLLDGFVADVWAVATPFADWWSAHPELHRDAHAATC